MDEKRHIIDRASKYPDLKPDCDFIFSDINLFKKDKKLFFIHKKTNRLVSAVYLLTDLFSDQEPMKWELRKWSLKIVPTVLSKKIFVDNQNWAKEVEISFLRLAGFVETAYLGGLVSDMNFSLITKEISSLISVVNNYSESLTDKGSYKIDSNLFWTDKRHYKGHESIKDIDKNPPPFTNKRQYEIHSHESVLKDKSDSMGRKFLDSEMKSHSGDTRKFEKNNRQMEIIGIIKDRETVSIKDISEIIKGCSEKTIQRELVSMVSSGVLKKEGERRWSKYSLNL